MLRRRDKDHPSVLIVNGQVTGAEVRSDTLVLEDGIIRFAGPRELLPGEIADRADIEVDAREGWLLPGFIDVHVHGGCGHDFMEADEAAYDVITRFHSANGTTAMLVTTLTSPLERISAVLEAVRAYRQGKMPYAQLLGVHLEGPFLSPKWPGAQNPVYIASLLASFNPAKRLGIETVTGRLKPGLQADVLMLSEELELERVWVKGREVRPRNGNGQSQ